MYSVNQVLGLLTHRPIGWVNFPRKSRVSFNYKSTLSTDKYTNTDKNDESSKNNGKQTYILNTNTKKFHKPDCRSVKQMSEKNKKQVKDMRDHIIDDGYDPCKICNP